MMTRQNAIPSEDGGHLDTALIPLWDMCNHANGTVCLRRHVHDGYWLKLGISKSDPLQEKRNDLLSRLTLEPTDRFFIKKVQNLLMGSCWRS
nr:unnamed protein product [Callosobruchus chinensis]